MDIHQYLVTCLKLAKVRLLVTSKRDVKLVNLAVKISTANGIKADNKLCDYVALLNAACLGEWKAQTGYV